MSNKQLFLDVLKNKKLTSKVPLWELHFHLWKKYDPTFVSGNEFKALSDEDKVKAIKNDARIMKEVGEKLGFGCVSIPDAPWGCIYELPQEYRLMLIRELKALNPDFALIGGCGGIFTMPSSGDNYMEVCYWIMDEPEEVDESCEKMFESFTQKAPAMIEAGLDALYVAADIADTRTTFLNREQLERWYIPYVKKCADFLHEQGVPMILHTDGNVNDILSDLAVCGVDGLQAIDPISGMSLEHTLDIFDGKVTACGNFDCGLMLQGTPEEVYESAKQILLSSKHKKGLIFGNSNAVVIETPIENYEAMLKAWNDFGDIE